MNEKEKKLYKWLEGIKENKIIKGEKAKRNELKENMNKSLAMKEKATNKRTQENQTSTIRKIKRK